MKRKELGELRRNPIEQMMKEEKPMFHSPLLKTALTASTSPSQQKNRVADDKAVIRAEGVKAVSLSFHGGSRGEESGREKLKRHRVEVAGQVWIPDIWGQENFLQDWIDSSAFDAAMGPKEIMSARASLVEEGRRAHSGSLSC